MKLTKITARNFKGLTFSLDLGAINFLVGSNFAGKTARTDAIRLLLLGYLPELGKLPRATFGLSSGREMEVRGTFDDGREVFRRWFLKGDTVKTDDNFRPDGDGSIVQSDLMAVMIDASTYFALSDRDRVSYVFANCPIPSGYSPDEITDRIHRVLKKDVQTIGDPMSEAATKIDSALVTLANEDGATPQTFVDAAITAMTETAKNAKDYAVRMEKTAQGLAGLRAQDAQQEKGLEALDADRVTLTAEIERLQGEKARYQAAYDLAQASKRRREDLTTAVRAKGGFTARRDTLRNSIDAKEHELTQIPAVDPNEVEALRSQEREAAMALRDYERDLRQVEESIANNERELAGVDAKTACPYCGAAGDGWKALKTGEINSALAGLRTKRDQLVAHVQTVKASAADLLTRFNEGRDAMNARRAVEMDLTNLRRDLEAAEKQIAVLEGKEQELAGIPSEDPTVIANAETATTALNVANDALRRLDEQRKAVLGRANDLKRLAEAETARDAAKLEETLAKAALEELRTIQRKMVEDAFRPLLTVANSFFGSILKSPLAYNDGEIGTWREGVWVGHRTFSGTEKALCYAAIQMALAASSPVRVMIVDELGRLDAGNAEKLLLAVGQAIKTNRIDQFIGISPVRPVDDLVEGCKVEMIG